MALTLKQKTVIKALIQKELQDLKKITELDLVNSPVLSTIYRMKEMDLQFIKTKQEYELFLKELIRKL